MKRHRDQQIVVLTAQDVMTTLGKVSEPVAMTMLDPWYNKGVGGVRDDYEEWLGGVLEAAGRISQHVFVWGFPEIVCCVLKRLPAGFELKAWLTWYYKNCPSVIRGWRSSQMTCLHIARQKAKIYPEHFLNGAQKERMEQRKLRFVPGPPSVIEAPLEIGFVRKSEQTGHPAQKPVRVIEPLVLMTTKPGDVVLDPMCGSGTTGVICLQSGRRAILCDSSVEYVGMTRERVASARARVGGARRSGARERGLALQYEEVSR